MLDLIIGGTAYSLDDGTYCYYAGDDGLGMAPVRRLSERGPQQHGDTDRGHYLEPRYFRLYLDIEAETYAGLWEKRRTLINLFKPQRSLALRWTFDDGTARQIDCVFADDMEMPSTERRAFAQRVVVGLKASDPTFYDPNPVVLTFQLSGGSDTWEVPFQVPFTVGASTIDASYMVIYEGDVASYPFIRIVGPITNAKLTNVGLGTSEIYEKILDFSGTTIASNDYYEIDLRYGRKTVVDKNGVNRIGNLSSDSDLATWRIEADPESAGGYNSIAVQGSSITTTTRVDILYYKRYLGI